MIHRILLAVLLGTALAGGLGAQATAPRITTPQQEFGHNFGDDYFLANYKQIAAYWQKLDQESDRMTVAVDRQDRRGPRSADGDRDVAREPRNLARYKDISRRLALAEGLTDEQARALAKEGKAIVWIDGGLHATETLGAQQLGEMVYQMVSRTDEETMRILDDVIILFVHANPDGNDLVADWYMRDAGPEAAIVREACRGCTRSTSATTTTATSSPRRRPRRENMNRVLYREWFPQILYNHHQSGPAGTILWSPPLRDPFNYNQDPLLVLGIQTIGLALHTRLAAEGKPGATMRSGGPYDGWWNGGIRNTAAFHNTIAILTEMIGNPTPMRVPLVMNRQLPTSDLTFPVPPQEWHFRQSVDYSVDLQSRRARHGVEDEGELSLQPLRDGQELDRAGQHATRGRRGRIATPRFRRRWRRASRSAARRRAGAVAEAGRRPRPTMALWAALHKPEDRDPRAYVIPSSQADFSTATRFINALLETGIAVHRATREFTAGGQAVSSRVVRRLHGAGVPAARDRHVRAAGSSGQLSLSGRAADAAVRQRGLDARVPDGHRVRSAPRAAYRSLRTASGLEPDDAGGRRAAGRRVAGHDES